MGIICSPCLGHGAESKNIEAREGRDREIVTVGWAIRGGQRPSDGKTTPGVAPGRVLCVGQKLCPANAKVISGKVSSFPSFFFPIE